MRNLMKLINWIFELFGIPYESTLIQAVCCNDEGCNDMPFADYGLADIACSDVMGGRLVLNATCDQNPCGSKPIRGAVCCTSYDCIDMPFYDLEIAINSCIMHEGTLIVDSDCLSQPCRGLLGEESGETISGGCESGGCETRLCSGGCESGGCETRLCSGGCESGGCGG
jgi:hypothetical protein